MTSTEYLKIFPWEPWENGTEMFIFNCLFMHTEGYIKIIHRMHKNMFTETSSIPKLEIWNGTDVCHCLFC